MDLPAQGLYQQLHAKPVSGEHLEVLGKNASEKWASGEYRTLTDAVVQTVKQAGLSPEQVRRVVEFANTDAFQREFKKESSPHHVVSFPGGPADPGDVLRDLNDGGGGTVFDRGTGDYNQPPKEKHSSAHGVEEALDQLFKTASSEGEIYPFESPLSETIELRDKIASMYDHMNAEIGGLELMFVDLSERLYDGVKQAAMGGTHLGVLAQAFESVAPTYEYIKVAFDYLAPRLLRDGVYRSLEQMGESADKTAGARVANPNHPLLVDFGEYCEVLSKLAHTRGALEEVREELGKLNLFVKSAGKGILPTVAHHLGEAAKVTGRASGYAAERLGGEGPHVDSAKKWGDRAVRWGVPAIAANEARRHLKHSPTFQAAKDTALSVVPMTQQYQQREYEIATGQ